MRILISILIFVSWLGISVKWYVCGIKELCDTESVEPVSESKEVTGNFVFYPKSDIPIVNEQSYKIRDSLIQVINTNDDVKLEIIGLYYTEEAVDSLAIYRAKNTCQKMFGDVDKSRILYGEATINPDTMLKNELFKGVQFHIINSVIVYFAHNQYQTHLSVSLLEEVKNLIDKSNTHHKIIIIEGHTDNVGSSKYNLQLSHKRANWLKKEIIKYGVDEKQVEIQAKGLAQPIATNDTEEGKQKNRRVKIIIN